MIAHRNCSKGILSGRQPKENAFPVLPNPLRDLFFDQEPIADAHQGRIDIDNDAPYRAALEGLRRLRNELPQLGQAIVPCGDCPLKISYDPIITDGLHLH